MNPEFQKEEKIFTAFTDQVKKDEELRAMLKETEKTIHVVCAEDDLPFADRLKAIIEGMAERGKDEPKVCSDESAIMDILPVGPMPIEVGGMLKRTEDVYIFIAPQRHGEKFTREHEQLFGYTKGAFSPNRQSHATMIAICPSSERTTFSENVYDGERHFIDARDIPNTVISKLKSGLVPG